MGIVAPVAAVAPFPGNGGDEPGLSEREIKALARWYEDRADALRHDGIEVDQEELDAGLRQVLRERVLPEFIEYEFERIMRAVFN